MKHYWWDTWHPEPPYRGQEGTLSISEAELQKLIDDITLTLPEIFTTDKKTLIKTKLQQAKKAFTELPNLQKDLEKTKKSLQVWETNQTAVINLVKEAKAASEEALSKESDKTKKKNLQDGIARLDALLNNLSGLNLAKQELTELVNQRINDYGWDDDEVIEALNKKVGKDWEVALAETTDANFNTFKSNLLRTLSEVLIDYYLTSTEEPANRLEIINNYLAEATETETQSVIKETTRAAAFVRLKDKAKSQKGTITLTMNGEMNIVDEENKSDNRMISFNFSDLRTKFDDFTAIGKLTNLNLTNQLNIYYNFTDDETEQNKRFKELKSQLENYKNRQLVFHFDKLEAGSHKLVRIHGKELHLDYNSYTKIEVSGGTETPPKPPKSKKWEDIHADFSNSQLVKNWTGLSFTWKQVKEWIDIGIFPDEQKLVSWLIATKKGDYVKPEWVLNNADIVKLRKEWLEYEIERRLRTYKIPDIANKFEKKGKDGHWGSEHRGYSWREYLSKIDTMEESKEFSYQAVRGGLLNCLAETLFPEFMARWVQKTSGKRNMKKTDILAYMNENCSPNENAYYNQIDGSIKLSVWSESKSVRTNIESLPND